MRFLLLVTFVSCLPAAVPDWLSRLAGESLPRYGAETEAVVLLDEQIATVRPDGEIHTVYRKALRILRPQGRERAVVRAVAAADRRIFGLKAWSIPRDGKPSEMKEKDAFETSLSPDALYADRKLRVLRIGGGEPGSTVGYEYEERKHPPVLQDIWYFQDNIPVRHGRFEVQLPREWELKTYWANYAATQPKTGPLGRYVFQIEDVPAVTQEPAMPAWRAVAGRLGVAYLAPPGGKKSVASWQDVGRWYWELALGRRQITPEIRRTVAGLTAGAKTAWEKVRALAGFVQRDIRYVAVEIGIGGYQPHAASEVLAARYGDCKDKATLLAAMLQEAGLDSWYVLIQEARGVVGPDFPTVLLLNHVILALRLPAAAPAALHSVQEHDRLGALLFFDPTDSATPLGYLPSPLQANYGLLVTDSGGELVRLPLAKPAANRLLRSGKLALSADGMLSGEVGEVRWGSQAVDRRMSFLRANEPDRTKIVENTLAASLSSFVLERAQLGNLPLFDQPFTLRYAFRSTGYAKFVGNMLILRPRVIGIKVFTTFDDKVRRYPIEFPEARQDDDVFEIDLPAGVQAEELPTAVDVDCGIARYRSRTEISGNRLKYSRSYELKEVLVPAVRIGEFRHFLRRVAADENASVVLKPLQ